MKQATFVGSSIGKKVIMATTGLILFGFVIGHMIGNLQVYLGSKVLNDYSIFLREFAHGAGLWVARAVLLAAVLLHIWSAYALTMMNRAARPIGYRDWTPRESTYASRTMRLSGVTVLAFVIYHLLHFTTGTVHPDYIPGDVYHNVISGLRVLPVAIFYIVAMLALGLHLYHGAWSMLQTLGLNHPRYNGLRFGVSVALAAVVTIGNLSFPATILAGLLS
ncbi:MAG TPA: succinate dehydrogenase cytochrome b subunit [Myxococcales bacterium]|nr:succinate dehydrogenase cytochrome b subunit [Myxococcales bacterium]